MPVRVPHPDVLALADRYLAAVDAARPGLVESLHVTGSAALGAWQGGHSDVDTVIVTSRVLDADDLAALAEVHRSMPEQPTFDGVYLDRDSFAGGPADGRQIPFAVNGEFVTDRPCGDLNPVLWLILDRYGITVRGDEPRVTVDREALRDFNLANLDAYWRPLAAQVREALVGVPDETPMDPGSVVWLILGPARLHYTLATGDVISKPAVAGYIGSVFPEWGELAARAASWRDGADAAFTAGDFLAAAASVDAIADAAAGLS